MKSKTLWMLSVLCLGAATALVWLHAQPGRDVTIAETRAKITVDGNLDDWEGIAEVPVALLPSGAPLQPSPDLTVNVRFVFDVEYFFAAVRVVDDKVEFPSQTRREGDGFYLTFVDPAAGEQSNRFEAFGFSRFGDEPLAIRAGREGEAEPFARDVLLKITHVEKQQVLIYELAIPWKYVPSFRPLIQQKWGINLVYDDLDDGQKEVVALVPDPNYDAGKSKSRRWLGCVFVPRVPESPEFQAELDANHYYPETEPKLLLAVNAPAPQSGWQARLILTSPDGNFKDQKPLSFGQGLQVVSLPVEIEKVTMGMHYLSLGLIDDKGALRYTEDKRFFLLDRKEFEALESKLKEAEKGDLAAKDPIFKESLPTLEIRFQWIKEFMDSSPPFADLESVQQWLQEIKDLFRSVDEGKPALFPPGRIVRLGFRSADGTLRPYSVFIPDLAGPGRPDRRQHHDQAVEAKEQEKAEKQEKPPKPAPRKPMPVFITLHDKNSDDRASAFGLSMVYYGPRVKRRAGDLIVLAPSSRSPDDGFAGASGKDVLECLDHLKKLYPVEEKKVILDGFGTGGYGAWRLGLLNPEYLRGLIIRSGTVSPPGAGQGEKVLDLLDRAKELRILIVHGDQDKDAPVEETRKVVARLQELKVNFEYLEVKGGGHGNYDRWEDIFRWLKDVLGASD